MAKYGSTGNAEARMELWVENGPRTWKQKDENANIGLIGMAFASVQKEEELYILLNVYIDVR